MQWAWPPQNKSMHWQPMGWSLHNWLFQATFSTLHALTGLHFMGLAFLVYEQPVAVNTSGQISAISLSLGTITKLSTKLVPNQSVAVVVLHCTLSSSDARRGNDDVVLPEIQLEASDLVTGGLHITVSRKFVDFCLYNESAQLLWDYFDQTGHLQWFFATLQHQPRLGVPGSYTGTDRHQDRLTSQTQCHS